MYIDSKPELVEATYTIKFTKYLLYSSLANIYLLIFLTY